MAKFKTGDEVFIINKWLHTNDPRFYPAEGSYGEVLSDEYDCIIVQYGANSGTAYDHIWSIDTRSLRKVTQKDRERAARYYAKYVFARALNQRDYYGSTYVKPNENKLLVEQEIKRRMQAEGGVDYRVLYANSRTFVTAYTTENILVVNTKSETYRYDLDFCRNEYTKRVEDGRKVDKEEQ